MGCIILELVVWLSYDWEALQNFTGSLDPKEYQYYRTKSSQHSQNMEPCEIWEVHPNVKKAMKSLRRDVRCRHTALEALVDLVEDGLLRVNYNDRLTAVALHNTLQAILDRAKKDPSYLVNMDALRNE